MLIRPTHPPFGELEKYWLQREKHEKIMKRIKIIVFLMYSLGLISLGYFLCLIF